MIDKMKQFLLVTTVGLLSFVLPTQAAIPDVKVKDEAYSARFVSQSIADPIAIEAGSVKIVTIKFKNTGTATWNSAGSKFISAYTMEPRDRKSAFMDDGWLSGKQTGKIVGTVKPGGTGELKINLQAPLKPGVYEEKFYLAAENYTWVKGGYFFLKITVKPANKKIIIPTVSTTPEVIAPIATGTEYGVNLIGIGSNKFTVSGGSNVSLLTVWRNSSDNAWNSYELVLVSSTSTIKQIIKEEKVIAPGDVINLNPIIQAPSKKGQYKMFLRFKVNGRETGDAQSVITLNFDVISDAPVVNTTDTPFVPRLPEEPRIRVGIWKPTSVVQFVSYDDDYNIYDGLSLVGVLPKGNLARMNFSENLYHFAGDGVKLDSINYPRLVPANNPHAIFAVYNYDHYVTWKASVNFNQYRGAMEYRQAENGTLYVINEVLFEDYVAGIAENSAGAPIEYIKANLVAARTYAYVHLGSTKHDSHYFDVLSTTADQLYLGYKSEVIMPRVAQAAVDTRGMMVTYQGKVVTTPYFGNSNGWTKSYASVWGGAEKPWLVPVQATYDAGRAKLGHGVGMSQRDCALRAEKEGLDYVSLLKYYYTGVEVEKIYN